MDRFSNFIKYYLLSTVSYSFRTHGPGQDSGNFLNGRYERGCRGTPSMVATRVRTLVLILRRSPPWKGSVLHSDRSLGGGRGLAGGLGWSLVI